MPHVSRGRSGRGGECSYVAGRPPGVESDLPFRSTTVEFSTSRSCSLHDESCRTGTEFQARSGRTGPFRGPHHHTGARTRGAGPTGQAAHGLTVRMSCSLPVGLSGPAHGWIGRGAGVARGVAVGAASSRRLIGLPRRRRGADGSMHRRWRPGGHAPALARTHGHGLRSDGSQPCALSREPAARFGTARGRLGRTTPGSTLLCRRPSRG
jgi:hypothetical protein